MVTIVERCTSQYWWLRLLKDVPVNIGGWGCWKMYQSILVAKVVERCTSQYWWLRLLKDVPVNIGGWGCWKM